jgi:hypothetical protein
MVCFPSVPAQFEAVAVRAFELPYQGVVGIGSFFGFDSIEKPFEFFRIESAIPADAAISLKHLPTSILRLRADLPAMHANIRAKGSAWRNGFSPAQAAQRATVGT